LDDGKVNQAQKKRMQSHSTLQVVAASAKNLASMLERATVGCFLDFQVTAPPACIDTHPETDFLLSTLLPQSASLKISSSMISELASELEIEY
jgi:hypothetical protein